MIKQNKTKLLFISGAFFFVSMAMIACNDKASEKTVVTDSVTTVIKDTIPVKVMDSGEVKPTPNPN